MRHSEKLIQAVYRAMPSVDPRARDAVAVMDALRAAEAEEMKTDRQALVDVISAAIDDAGATAEVPCPPPAVNAFECVGGEELAPAIADAILADFNVSMREDETEPVR